MGVSADTPGDDSLEGLSTACSEGREVIDHQVEWARQIDDKAIRFIRINILLLGLGLTAFSLSSSSFEAALDQYLNIYTLSGILALLGSMVTAALTFGLTSVKSGISARYLRHVSEGDISDRQLYEGLALGYAEWIEHNKNIIEINVATFMITVVLVVDSIILLTAGTIIPTLGYADSGYFELGFIVLVAILYCINKVVYNVDDWVSRYQNFREGERQNEAKPQGQKL